MFSRVTIATLLLTTVGLTPALAGEDMLEAACGSAAAVTAAGIAPLLGSAPVIAPVLPSADDGFYKIASTLTLPAHCLTGGQGEVVTASGSATASEAYVTAPGTMLGLGSAVSTDTVASGDAKQVWRVGPQAALSLGDLTVQGWAGLADGDALSPMGFAGGTIAYYATDDVRISMGLRRDLGAEAALVGAEWQPNTGLPMSLFAEGGVASDEGGSLMGGLRWYFGQTKPDTLKERDAKTPFISRLLNFFGGH